MDVPAERPVAAPASRPAFAEALFLIKCAQAAER